MAALTENASRLRGMVARKIILRTSPRIGFKLDTSFEVANRINVLLNSERVKADVNKPVDGLIIQFFLSHFRHSEERSDVRIQVGF